MTVNTKQNGINGTEGVIYALSPDNLTATVVYYEGDEESVTISESYKGVPVVEIGHKAFYKKNIRSVKIPDSVVKIGEKAFSHCSMLSEIQINCETIEMIAFLTCYSLKRVFIGKRVKSIGANAFGDCPLIEAIEVDGDNTEFKSENGCLLTKDGSLFIRYPSASLNAEYSLPTSVKRICPFSFNEAKALERVTLDDALEVIDDGAFSNCSSLSEVNFGSNLSEMKSFAFSNCKSLKEIVFPDSLATVGGNSFAYCEGLKRVTIGSGVKKIMVHAFDFCDSLEEVYFKVKNLWKVRREVFGEKELSDPKTAAKYLTSTYTFAIWQRLGDD